MGSNNKATVEDRVLQVAEWLLVPYTSSEIVALCRTEWNACRRTAFDYIKQANERIAEENDQHLAAEIVKAKTRMERIARKAEEDKEYTASIAAQRELNKLMGLEAPQRSEVKHNVSFLDELVNEEDRPQPLEQQS